jgi:multiple antibiotic resistance protein
MLLIGGASTLAAASAALAQAGAEPPISRHPTIGQVFVLFFLMLGPIKLVAPFALMVKDAEAALCRRLARRATAIAAVTTLIAAALGHAILENWNVSIGALLIAGGSILFVIALRLVLQQYAPLSAGDPGDPTHPGAALRLAFPTIVTPYGIATVIIVLSVSPDASYTLGVAVTLVGVMLLNLLAMLSARRIFALVGAMPLQIVAAVLGVMQVALGVQMILWGLGRIGVLDQTRI